MVNHHGLLEEKRLLNHRLVYGYYPEIVNNPGEEESRLKQLSSSYLYKDILTWERIQKADKMERLVQALAFQVGSEASFDVLGQMTGLDNETTEKYIDLLEKSFIVFRLGSLRRNLRNGKGLMIALTQARHQFWFGGFLCYFHIGCRLVRIQT